MKIYDQAGLVPGEGKAQESGGEGAGEGGVRGVHGQTLQGMQIESELYQQSRLRFADQ